VKEPSKKHFGSVRFSAKPGFVLAGFGFFPISTHKGVPPCLISSTAIHRQGGSYWASAPAARCPVKRHFVL